MKTRAQRKKENNSHPYKRKSVTTKSRIFLITEKNGDSGWVSNAVTPDAAVTSFQTEVTNTKGSCTLKGSIKWIEYTDIENTMPSTDRPCYMSMFKLNQKDYYIELLTKPNSKVGWIPTSFD